MKEIYFRCGVASFGSTFSSRPQEGFGVNGVEDGIAGNLKKVANDTKSILFFSQQTLIMKNKHAKTIRFCNFIRILKYDAFQFNLIPHWIKTTNFNCIYCI